MHAGRWSDLSPDLAREISGRLHDPTDFVRFHAVCRPWRGSWSPTATTAGFLPWLLAAVNHQDSTRFEMRCVLSNSNYRSQPLLFEPCGNWVTSSSNGTALRCLTIQDLRPSLHDLLTGAVTHMPLLPHDLGMWYKEIKPTGVIYADGATLLYSISYSYARAMGGVSPTARFSAALLRPDDTDWENNRYQPGPHACLLDVTMSVQALEEPLLSSSPVLEKMRWVTRDGRTLGDRVLFLGTRHSFVVDAGWVPDGHGGCAYFVCHTNRDFTYGYGDRAVFRCNLIDGKTKLVQRLPRCWDDNMCTWFNAESVITPPQEISKRSQEQQPHISPTISGPPIHTLRIERHRVPSYRLLVRNLPLTLKSAQLRLFFSEHGKVSSAEVICYKKTGASQGIGHVTIEMTHAHEEDASAALTGLILDGCRLEVSMVKEGQQRWPRRQHRHV